MKCSVAIITIVLAAACAACGKAPIDTVNCDAQWAARDAKLTGIVVGTSTKSDVEAAIGSPSASYGLPGVNETIDLFNVYQTDAPNSACGTDEYEYNASNVIVFYRRAKTY